MTSQHVEETKQGRLKMTLKPALVLLNFLPLLIKRQLLEYEIRIWLSI